MAPSSDTVVGLGPDRIRVQWAGTKSYELISSLADHRGATRAKCKRFGAGSDPSVNQSLSYLPRYSPSPECDTSMSS